MENTARQVMKSSDKNNGADAKGAKRRPFSERWSEERESKREQAYLRSVSRAYEELQVGVFDLVNREEVEELARKNGYTLKSSANPVVEKVRHGVFAPRRSEGKKLSKMEYCRTHDTFDLDARFSYETADGTKQSVTLRVVGVFNKETEVYHCYVTTLSPEEFSPEEIADLYCLRWVIELLFKLLKSSCHLDYLDTKNPEALRTFIYASLLMATILSAMAVTAARHAGLPPNEISVLMLGHAAPLMAIPLMLLWQDREPTKEEMAAMLMKIVVNCCRQQNRKRAHRKWGHFVRHKV